MGTITMWELAGAEDERLFSPYCWRSRMACAHKGLAVKSIPWRFSEKDAIAFSGQGLVPVIRDGERAVADSWAIAEYLEEAYPDAPKLFDGPQARALAFFFKHWTERTIHLPMLRVVVLDLYRNLHEKDKPYFRESREKRFGKTLEEFGGDAKGALVALRTALDPVRPVLVAQKFISGESPAFADYILFGTFQWARVMSPARLLEPDDPVYAWRERMLDLHGGLARNALGYPVWA
jgi:glutathione S-transferase